MSLTEELLMKRDDDYRDFQSKLLPTVEIRRVIGVRVPAIRTIARKYRKSREADIFLNSLPHTYYDEDILHAFLIMEIKDFDECVSAIEAFLPYVDNWAVCDTLSPPVFKKHRDKLLPLALLWLRSKATYTVRYGISMLMKHFLDENFDEGLLAEVAAIRSNEYYVKMMVAWYFATALAKHPQAALPYFEGAKLEKETLKMAIRKAIESYRISSDLKEKLRGARALLTN